MALLAALAAVLVVPSSAEAAEPASSTLVVDRDGVQCGNAEYISIQAAVDAAQPGDRIKVCPDLYAESVTVDKPLTLFGDPDAVDAVDCFQPTPSQLDDADSARQVIIDPAGGGFTIALALRADDIEVAGIVVQGASVGVDASDRFSGYRIHHNLIRLNSLFGVDFGSAGPRQTRADHSCLRENRYGLVSELDDDSLWASPPVADERSEWNQRDVRNARVDHNLTFRNVTGIDLAGPGHHDQLTIDHNVSREDGAGIALQNSNGSAILENDVARASSSSIQIGGATSDLTIDSNIVVNGRIGIIFTANGFNDRFRQTSHRVQVTRNTVRGMTFSGINANPGTAQEPGDLHDSTVADNISTDNGRDGIVLFAGNSGNEVRGNVSERNGRNGIYAAGARDNTFIGNTALLNVAVDARDDNRPVNTWTGNQCVTDSPAGTICGAG
ncbi:right-handed parallel beta-helix repeat-containing protein [Micromonospora kangleipakensis]|nr:right-handed parallel beta-helix repeat-containing protein [Micromonospora kangleipakensis]